MRASLLALVVAFGFGCGEPETPSNAEVEALLQRLDTMSRRLDALEEALAREQHPDSTSRLPPAAVSDPGMPPPRSDDEPHTLRVDLSPAGVTIDDQLLDHEDARRRFREAARKSPETRLVLLAEPEVPHADVVEILDLAREAGLRDVAMSARVHGEGKRTTAAR